MMPIPIINKPEDRCPYSEGTVVQYWHHRIDSRGRRTGEILRPHDRDGSLHHGFSGIVEMLNGEKVIRILDADGKPSKRVERIMHLPPLHQADNWITQEPEPQRWFAEGETPNAD